MLGMISLVCGVEGGREGKGNVMVMLVEKIKGMFRIMGYYDTITIVNAIT